MFNKYCSFVHINAKQKKLHSYLDIKSNKLVWWHNFFFYANIYSILCCCNTLWLVSMSSKNCNSFSFELNLSVKLANVMCFSKGEKMSFFYQMQEYHFYFVQTTYLCSSDAINVTNLKFIAYTKHKTYFSLLGESKQNVSGCNSKLG